MQLRTVNATPSDAPRTVQRRPRRFGTIRWALLGWTIAFAVWWGPTVCSWWRDYRDIVTWQETGGPPYPRQGSSFVQDLPFKVAVAVGILGLGYAIIAALAAVRAVARRHADLVLGPVRE